MSTIATLAPDQALESILKDRILVNVSADDVRVVPVYRQGGRPNNIVDEEFIEILNNGLITAITKPLGIYKGHLAIVVYCKSFPDGTTKFGRIESIMAQLENLVNFQVGLNTYFEIDYDNLITPLTYDAESGYSMVVLNVEWHTTK